MTISPDQLRAAMSTYPTGVTVVTTSPDGFPAFGMTVNSFTSLSLEPPLIMWNLQKSSDTLKAWKMSESFAVNFLRDDQAELSNRFAIPDQHQLQQDEAIPGESGCPVLAKCLATLECRIHARHEAGDHIIIIGEVLAITVDNKATPLVYVNNEYTKPK